ncbi:MAG: CBS domain-containing protein, partial [Chloroflexota bacterium]
QAKIRPSSLEATLMALGIYADTGNFTYGGTTARDIQAAAWLVEQGAALDTVRRFLNIPLNSEQHQLFEKLLDNIEARRVAGFDIIICTAQTDKRVASMNSVVAVLQDVLDADALIILVQTPTHIQMIARSKVDAIHVGKLAETLSGGGHPRAAAATVYSEEKQNLSALTSTVWAYLSDNVQPAVRVADIMSFGDIRTVEAEATVSDIITRLRRLGHEGYPVIDDNQHVVGLLTLRDADKALEHGLKNATVREVMTSGAVYLHPNDPLSALEETMVATDWGQIPIVEQTDAKQLIGIVTRTDLIKHWAQKHPTSIAPLPQLNPQTITDILGADNHTLIAKIAEIASERNTTIYMVGGVVRDLLLKRPNYDIDFVVEGDGIAFATALQERFGGNIHPYPPFGTATWSFSDDACAQLGVDRNNIPEHIDFATARSELYTHPTALPTVYNSGIKLDLRRRDFTINALAVQLSPTNLRWQLVDFYGGMADLDERLIRVLHSLSFVDDPTRIMRAVRFSERLHFTIELRTAELIHTALPMLKRITGERLQNELTLILQEPAASRAISKLAALHVLEQIHPAFTLHADFTDVFSRLSDTYPTWTDNLTMLKWHILLAQLTPDVTQAIAEKLLFSTTNVRALTNSAKWVHKVGVLGDADAKTSAVVRALEGLSAETLLTIWLWHDDRTVREHLERYQDDWQHRKPTLDGNTLKEMGLRPGPHFRVILARLRDAHLDNEIASVETERTVLNKIIAEVMND